MSKDKRQSQYSDTQKVSGCSDGEIMEPKSQSRFVVLHSVLPTFICYLAIGLPIAVLPGFIHEQMGVSITATGAVMSLQYLATCLVRPLAGKLVDHAGPKPAVVWGLTTCCVSGLLLSLSVYLQSHMYMHVSALLLLLISRAALGLAESWTATGVIIWGIQTSGIERATTVISWNGVASYGGIAVGAPLGALLGAGLNDTTVQLEAIGVIIALLSSVTLWPTLPRNAIIPLHANKPMPFHHVMGKIKFFGLALALGSVGFTAISTFAALYYTACHWEGASLALSAFAICFISIRFIFSGSIQRHGGVRVAMAALTAEALGLLLLAVAPSPLYALIATGLTGAGFSLLSPALGTEVVQQISPENRGAALGAFTLFFDIALGLGGPLMGWLASEKGYGAVFTCSALIALTGVLTSYAALYRHSR